MDNSNKALKIKRKLNKKVKASLNNFLRIRDLNNVDGFGWVRFYEFITVAYNSLRAERPSVSQLSDILKERGCLRPGSLAVLYAHGLQILSVSDGYPLQKTAFYP